MQTNGKTTTHVRKGCKTSHHFILSSAAAFTNFHASILQCLVLPRVWQAISQWPLDWVVWQWRILISMDSPQKFPLVPIIIEIACMTGVFGGYHTRQAQFYAFGTGEAGDAWYCLRSHWSATLVTNIVVMHLTEFSDSELKQGFLWRVKKIYWFYKLTICRPCYIRYLCTKHWHQLRLRQYLANARCIFQFCKVFNFKAKSLRMLCIQTRSETGSSTIPKNGILLYDCLLRMYNVRVSLTLHGGEFLEGQHDGAVPSS